MQRVTISLDEQLAREFDELSKAQSYQSRSEAVRDLVRSAVEQARLGENGSALCVANLSYVYNHHTRSLAQRITEVAHDHHDLVIATTHVHLDHEDCLETVIMRGPIDAIRSYAAQVRAERGVRFAELNLIRISEGVASAHEHGNRHHDDRA